MPKAALQKPTFQVVFSASKAFCRWIKQDFPRLRPFENTKLGVQSITSNKQQVSWQLHVIAKPSSPHLKTVIAVEAHSRFTILMPYAYPPSIKEFEAEFSRRWVAGLTELLILNGFLKEHDVNRVYGLFLYAFNNTSWHKNVDLSVNGHVADAEQWVRSFLIEKGETSLNKHDAQSLAAHINCQYKKVRSADGHKDRFVPTARFIEDSLSRIEVVFEDNDPHEPSAVSDSEHEASNVISMADYLKANPSSSPASR